MAAEVGLYATLAGAVWDELPGAFRAVHGPGEARGRLDVSRSPARAARALAWLCGLPREGRGTELALRVEQDGPAQVWRRRFGATEIVTRQRARAGLLCEQFGLLELGFRLVATRQGLRFDQRAATLVLGPLRLPWPRWLAPRIAAEVRPLDSGAAVDVQVRAPLFGLILRYAGQVHPCEAR